jgi:hypothetical protein
MTDNMPRDAEESGLSRAIHHAEAALFACDEHGFVYAAIDISSALDKLKAIRDHKGSK